MEKMMKKVMRIKHILYSAIMLLSIVSFSFGKEDKRLNVPLEFNENIKVENYDTEIITYDFNKDGTEEKIMVNIQNNDGILKTVVSIYTFQNGNYRLSYQIPFEKEVHFLNINYGKNQIEKIKEYYNDYSKNLKEGEIRYITILDNNAEEKVYFDLKFDKYSPKDLDNFLFIKSLSVFKEAPEDNSETVFSTSFKDKPKALLEIITDDGSQIEKWYLAELGKEKPKRGFIHVENGSVIRRGFYWDEMQSKMSRFNRFIEDSQNSKYELYTIKEYKPMTDDVYSKKDRYGNRNNQSIIGYSNADKTGYRINIPDQTVFRIIGEKDDMIEIETPYYPRSYFIKNNPKTFAKWEVKEKVNKFIVIDTESQTEGIFERDNKNKYKVITYSFVTTGKDNGWSSYETPKGMFLVAATRPFMAFGKKVIEEGKERIEIAGTAKGAIRFSGGGYMHGIRTALKGGEYGRKVAEEKVGTFKDSHKCVRHFDDQITFIVDWVNAGSTTMVRDYTIPEDPVVVIVL